MPQSLAFVRWHNRSSRYNRLWVRATSVASIEMPKWIMHLVPDVPLGAEVWVTAVGRSARYKQFLGSHRLRGCSSTKPMESEAPW